MMCWDPWKYTELRSVWVAPRLAAQFFYELFIMQTNIKAFSFRAALYQAWIMGPQFIHEDVQGSVLSKPVVDSHINTTQPYKPEITHSQPMKFQTYKKHAYAHCNSTLNDKTTFEQQYKEMSTSQTKQLQDKPYLYTTFENDTYFENWATKQ